MYINWIFSICQSLMFNSIMLNRTNEWVWIQEGSRLSKVSLWTGLNSDVINFRTAGWSRFSEIMGEQWRHRMIKVNWWYMTMSLVQVYL